MLNWMMGVSGGISIVQWQESVNPDHGKVNSLVSLTIMLHGWNGPPMGI